MWRIDCRVVSWIQEGQLGDCDNNTDKKSLWVGLREVAMELVKSNGNSFQVGPARIAGGLDEELERRISFCSFSESWVRYVCSSIMKVAITFNRSPTFLRQLLVCSHGFQFILVSFLCPGSPLLQIWLLFLIQTNHCLQKLQ